MFAYRTKHYKGHSMRVWTIALIAALALLGVAGCGEDEEPTIIADTSTTDSTDSSTTTPDDEDEPARKADTADADPDDLRVIEDWSRTLSEGDVEGAAGYFATPSTVENGFPIEIRNLEDAVAFNEMLPCGAEVISAKTVGAFTTATFSLSERPGGDCGLGVGGTASTSFVIEDGEIVEWRRLSDPGDTGGGGRGGGGAPA